MNVRENSGHWRFIFIYLKHWKIEELVINEASKRKLNLIN
jgi:hypothetical protein